MSARVRAYAGADRDAVNAVARAAFAQYERDYDDWPGFIEGIGRTPTCWPAQDVPEALKRIGS